MGFRVLINTLSAQTIVNVFSSILCEGRVIFYSRDIAKLSQVIQSVLELLYPFKWQVLTNIFGFFLFIKIHFSI